MIQTKQRTNTIYKYTYTQAFLWIILSIGIFLRLFHYFQNRSLYTDEAYLANNLLNRNFAELTQPLDASQHAPVLFLFIEKLSINLFNPSEFVLRFFPLLCGIGALIGFYYLLKGYDEKTYIHLYVGLIIFALSFPLIYYSSEFKQYSTEVLCTIVAYLLYFRYKETKQLKHLFIYGLIGSIVVWLSYSSIFILASIGLVTTIRYILKKEWGKLIPFGLVYASWAASFLLNLILIIVPNSLSHSHIIDTWKMAYMPLSLNSVGNVKWFILAIYGIFDFPLNLNWTFLNEIIHPKLTFSFIGFLTLLIGIFALFKRRAEVLLIILLPIVLTLVASALEKYPFTERFLLFLTPNFTFLIAVGAAYAYRYIKSYSKLAALSLLLLLLLPPTITAAKDLVYHPHFGDWKRREMKDIISYLQKNRQSNDYIFLYPTASAFNYYNQIYNLHWPNYTMLSEEAFIKTNIEHRLNNQNSKRFWIIVVGNLNNGPTNERNIFINRFDNSFKKVKEFNSVGAYTALYEVE